MKTLEEFLADQEVQSHPVPERSRQTPVLATLQLRETARKWFVIGTEMRDGDRVLVGYEPRCRYDSSGNGWFALPSEFFLPSARATQDVLDVIPMDRSRSIEDLDVDDVL